MSNARRTSIKNKADEVPVLKMKITELEGQVAEYKKRMDDLRKAKNTTILKREREIVDVKAPNLGRRDSSVSNAQLTDLEKQLKDLKQCHLKEKEELMKKHRDELENLRKEENQTPSCNHEPELEALKSSLKDAESDIAVLRMENQDLRERVEGLMMELSVKEAEWCETEEALNLKLKQQWGEKYREWMEETERKLAELQEANTLLRGYLKEKRPRGPDPSGQDPTF